MLIDLPTRISNIAFELRIIDAQTAYSELAINNGLLIDVREASEVESKAVNAAILIPRGVLEMKMLALTKEVATPIYLFCASGMRAKLSAEQLLIMGYENVSVISCPVEDIITASGK